MKEDMPMEELVIQKVLVDIMETTHLLTQV
jgi:hypothetical protein